MIDRADGTIKRGRGRGRGGRSRGGSSTHQVPIAAAVPISQETGLPLRGPGSRGGSTTRRPRPSKPRQQAEQDKQGASSATSQGRGGGQAGRGGGAAGTRGGKTPSMLELAPAPRPSLAPAPPGPVRWLVQSWCRSDLPAALRAFPLMRSPMIAFR